MSEMPPAGAESVAFLASLDPGALTGSALLDAVVACQRLGGWVDATQQTLLAAFARPGVAVPIDRVVDAARWSNAKAGELSASDVALDAAADPATDPRCATAVAHHAARFAAMEIGAALHLSPLAARARVEHALHLVDAMPRTLAAQRRGDIDPLRTRILAEATASLPAELADAVLDAATARAATCTPSQLRAEITRTVIRLDPEGAADRAKRAKRARDVYSQPQPDEMASVTALLAADKAARMMWLLNVMADGSRGPDDDRDAGQRRADALTDIIDALTTAGHLDIRRDAAGAAPNVEEQTDAPTNRRAHAAPRVCLTVYVNATTLAGLDDLPADIAGHGPVTADLARDIAASATIIRTALVYRGCGEHGSGGSPTTSCVHPGCAPGRFCGTTLDFGREVYRPPAALDDHIRTRDRVCRFPGCRMPAMRCDLDHATPFEAGGATCPCNLNALCRQHHLAKTFTGWTEAADTQGNVTWRSPLGRSYTDPPEHSPAPELEDDPPPY